jgi:hypothetical protein
MRIAALRTTPHLQAHLRSHLVLFHLVTFTELNWPQADLLLVILLLQVAVVARGLSPLAAVVLAHTERLQKPLHQGATR